MGIVALLVRSHPDSKTLEAILIANAVLQMGCAALLPDDAPPWIAKLARADPVAPLPPPKGPESLGTSKGTAFAYIGAMAACRSLSSPAPASDLFATAMGNLLVLLVLPPMGFVGLLCCYLARRAVKVGDLARAHHHLTSASAVARVSLYGSLAIGVASAMLGVLPFVLMR